MTGLIRKATLFSVVGLVVAGVAMASVPNEATSTHPTHINLVGHNGGVADARATVTYVIRDANNTPVPSSQVVLNFTQCTDVRLATGPSGGPVDPRVNCGAKTFTGTTDGLGSITFTVMGLGTALASRSVCNCVTVTVGGQPFSNIGAAAFNRDGSTSVFPPTNNVGSGDLGAVIGDFFAQPAAPADGYCRSDFAGGNNRVGSEDLGELIDVFFDASSAAPVAPCP